MGEQDKNLIGGIVLALLLVIVAYFVSSPNDARIFGITGAAGDRWVANTTLNFPPSLPASGYSSVAYFTNDTGTYAVMKFTADGTLTVTRDFTAEVLVIGGGAGGGSGSSGGPNGGGGAGDVLYDGAFAITASGSPYSVTIGQGAVYSEDGGTTTFSSFTAHGGGQGGAYRENGGNGACGGGGGSNTAGTVYTGGTGTDPGKNGGSGSSSDTTTSRAGGGGGGTTVAGNNAASGSGGTGGAGISYNLTGAEVCYGGGGGGGSSTTSGGAATCGGGRGGNCGGVAGTGQCNGTDGTGGGGGGGNQTLGFRNGGTGGDGVVIITYQVSSLGAYTTPNLYYRNDHLLLTVGSDENIASFEWNGSLWVQNDSWHSGITLGDETATSYFIFNDREYMLVGTNAYYPVYPYIWDGTNWIRPSLYWGTNKTPTSVLYMLSVSPDSEAEIFASEFNWGSHNFLAGSVSGGALYAYSWNASGNAWVANSSLDDGLTTALGRWSPRVFYNKNTAQWNVISGESNGANDDKLAGWYWDGDSWAADANIYKGIAFSEGKETNPSAIAVVNSKQTLMIGNNSGTITAWQYNTTIPAEPTVTIANFGVYTESPNINLNVTCDGDNSSYLLNITLNGVNVKDSIAVADAVVYSYSQNFSAGAWHINATCWNGTYMASKDSFIYSKLNKTGGIVMQEAATNFKSMPLGCDYFSECSDAGKYINDSALSSVNTIAGLYDGSYTTYTSRSSSEGNAGTNINITYVIPTNTTAVVNWTVKDTNGTAALTIPAACWAANTTHLHVRGTSYYHSTAGSRYTEWACYNSTAWVSLRKTMGGYYLYEEAVYWNITASEYPPETSVDTNVSIWNGSSYITYNATNKMSFRCGNPPVICQPTNQNNATSQPILLNVNNGTAASTYQSILGNTTFATAELRCGTNVTGPAANINVTTTVANISTSSLAAGANQSIYCFLNVTSVPANFPRSFNISVVNH